MKPGIYPSLLSMIAFLVVSCGGDDAKIAKGFRLPEGDAEKGKEAFLALNCHRCHTVAETTIPEGTQKSEVQLNLGGEVYRVKTYGQLVTSIIKPDHVVSEKYLRTLEKEKRKEASEDSPMPSINDRMTVAQLVDIVTFLHSRYKKLEPEYSDDYEYMP